MDNYEEKRNQLINQSNNLLTLIQQKLPNSLYKNTLIDLLADLESDGQMITVLGEFKRGKSTLLNAIIKNPLLPSDVTPTTATINVIKHAEEASMSIIMRNGEIIPKELSNAELQQFTFEERKDLQQIHHIDIGLPHTHLDKRCILVDTPGVGDLNEHRLDVTYSFIPRSNLIIFVFDATTPIRKTELDYLRDTVLKLKFGEIIFVANFIDRLDEDEWEDTMDYMNTRLQKIMGEEPFKLFPLSSKEALTNTEDTDFNTFISYMKERMIDGRTAKIKMEFFTDRVINIFNQVEEEIRSIEVIRNASLKELETAYEQLEQFKTQTSNHIQTLNEYISHRKEDIISLTFKSIDYLEIDLKESVRESIFLYEGTKFQSFIEKNIPISIKKRINLWVNQYSPQIDTLIKKLESEILKGFSVLFQQEMNSLRLQHTSRQLEGINLTVKTKSDSSDTTITSGLITAGAGTIMILLSGGFLLPVITLAGYPFLNKFLAEKKLGKLKEEVTPLIEQEIYKVINNLKKSTSQYIDNEVKHLQEKALKRFKQYLISYEQNLELEMSRKTNEKTRELPSIELKDFLLIKQNYVIVSK